MTEKLDSSQRQSLESVKAAEEALNQVAKLSRREPRLLGETSSMKSQLCEGVHTRDAAVSEAKN